MEDEEPDGWCLVHNRASGSSTLWFGPFEALADAEKWWEEVGQPQSVGFCPRPLFKTIDWRR